MVTPAAHAPVARPGHAATALPTVVDDTPTGPAAIVGAVLIVLLVVACVLLARGEDAATATLAASRQAQQAALEQRDPSVRIRTALLGAQAAAERVWRASTPPAERRSQEAAMMQRFHAAEQAVVTQQRLRQAGNALALPDAGRVPGP